MKESERTNEDSVESSIRIKENEPNKAFEEEVKSLEEDKLRRALNLIDCEKKYVHGSSTKLAKDKKYC